MLADGYKSQNKFVEARECFKKSLSVLDNTISYYSDSSYPTYNILLLAVKCRDKDLIGNVLKTSDNKMLKQIKTDVLFELIKVRDLSSLNYFFSEVKDIDLVKEGNSAVTALHIVCSTNDIKIVEYFLSKDHDLTAKNIIDFMAIESAALGTAIACEFGDENIVKLLLEKYRDTGTEIDDETLERGSEIAL